MCHGFQEKVREGYAALSGMIIRLVAQPAMARPTMTIADFHQYACPNSPVTDGNASQLPSTVPSRTGSDRGEAEDAVGGGDLV